MPRRGKGQKRKGPPSAENEAKRARKTALSVAKATFWKGRIRAAKAEKAAFSDAARDVDAYFKSKHEALFGSEAATENFMEFSGAAAVSVPKAAQIRGAMGPHLYPLNPKRTVSPKSADGVMLGLSRALAAYINRTPRESKLARQCRKVIDDSLLRGRGFMRTGYDPMLGIVTSWYESSKNVLIDPDVTDWVDAEWIAIRKVMPLWRAKREIKDKWRKKNLRGNFRSIEAGEEDDGDQAKSASLTNDLLECYEVYSKMGAGQLGLDFPDSYKEEDNDYVKITVSLTHDVPLGETDWETPFYLDRDWPLEPIDFVETLDELWPESVMSQVLPLQKTMDLLTSLRLNSCKMRGKFVMLGAMDLPAKAQQQIRNGTPAEYVTVKLKPGERLSDKFMHLPLGSAPTEISEERAFLERQFEATTGLTSAITGASEGQAKDRSATASRLRGQATNARLGDMRARVEEWATNVARHEAIMVRLELDAEEVDGYVTKEDIDLFVVAVTPSDSFQAMFGVGEIPLRSAEADDMSLETMAGEAATFYPDAQQAQQAALAILNGLLTRAKTDEVAYALVADMGITSMEDVVQPDPATGQVTAQLPPQVTIRPVTATDVWSATSGMTAEEMCRELAYEIATGSMAKFDKSREIETAELALQNVMPAALNVAQQTGNGEVVNAIWHRIDEAHEIPMEKRLPPIQFAPPMPQGPPPGGK